MLTSLTRHERLSVVVVSCTLLCLSCGKTANESPSGAPVGSTGGAASGGAYGGDAAGGSNVGGGTTGGGSGGTTSPRSVFPCADGTSVEADLVCNGVDDCLMGEEEANCPVFYCDNGWRIFGRQLCDGPTDCPNGEDEWEENCLVLGTGFSCGSEQIPRRAVCDGTLDCSDGSDEAVCPGFLCHDGTEVVPQLAPCDGSEDCSDGSDEYNCLIP